MKMKLTLIMCLMIVVASCSKDNDDDTNTPDKTIEQLLTEKAWKADELRIQLSNNTNTYYKRGGTSNTANYDSDSLRFNTNNTGTYYFSGAQYATTWNFIDADQFKMTIVINYPTPITVNLENIHITQNFFKYAQYSTNAGVSYLASGTRTQN